jgi:ligand-binding sensor domain-containing protein
MTVTGNGYGQGYSYTHYDEKDGLPSSTVYGITQDINGFIWFATENGLTRFDGKNFKTYTTRDGLRDNAVMYVLASKSGKLYFGPFTHPPSYILNDSIHQLKIAPQDVVPLSIAGTLYQQGNRVVATIEGIYGYAFFENDTAVRIQDLYPGLPDRIGIRAASDSMLTVSNYSDMYFVNTKTGVIRHRVDTGFAFYIDTTMMFIGHYREKYNLKTAYNETLGRKWHYFIVKDYIYLLDLVTLQIKHTLHIPRATRVFMDSEDNIWVATNGDGVYRFPSLAFNYTRFAKPSNEVFSIIEHNGEIWASSNFSIVRRLKQKDTLHLMGSNDYSSYLERSMNLMSNTSASNRILRLFARGDTLYMICDAFLLKANPGNKIQFSPIFPCKDMDTTGGKLLISTGTGAMILDAKTLAIEDTLLRQRTTTCAVYNGQYYIGTLGGLVKINPVDKSQTWLYSRHPGLKNRIISIRKGWDNDLWVATSGSGLIHLKNDKVIGIIDGRSGLTSDICTSLYIDHDTVWVGTNAGLNRISFKNATPDIMWFSTSNGLVSNFINCIYTKGNIVYVGSNDGIIYFNKNESGSESICKLHITGISQGNKLLRIDSAYTFPFDALNIKIDFTAISFKSAGNNTYYYKLVGLDSGWNSTTNTFVNFPTLPDGEYTLLIRAVNKFGVESETKSIRIIITPPWWQTWWFISLAGIAFATIVFFIYRRNIDAIKRREKIKRSNETRLAALEQQALQAQMNPHFIFNCLNSIQAFILDFDAEGANQYLTAFASMIRQTLDISSHPLISVADEVRYLDTYLQLEKLRFREKFNYRIQVAEEIDTFGTWIPGMLLQPFIENALRHGIQHRTDNEGMIVLEIKPEEKAGIACMISDNGIGRKRAEEIKSRQHIEYQSKGTFISQKRVNAINSQFNTTIRIETEDIVDEEGSIEGTVVKIIIPELRKN